MSTVSYTFVSQTDENEDLLDTYITSLYPIGFFPNESNTITQSIVAEDGKITGTLVMDTTTLNKSKPTANTNNLIITEPNLVQSLTLLAGFSIPVNKVTSVTINTDSFLLQSFNVINGKKYYYMVDA